MGTRPGALDPGVILHLFQTLGLSANEVETMLYKKSGLLGISGISNDMRDLLGSDDPAARLAVDYFVYRAAKEIGALAAALGGLDGAGVHGRHRRELAGDPPPDLRGVARGSASSSTPRPTRAAARASRRPQLAVSAWVIPTNEELMIARHTGEVAGARTRQRAPERQRTAQEQRRWIDGSMRPHHGDRTDRETARRPVRRGAASDTGLWQKEIDVRDFIQQNYEPYDGDESFLAPATARTQDIWDKLNALFVEERRKGVLDVSQIPSSITAHAPGYIDREHEVIVGLQTDAPLKRAIMPNGGFRMVAQRAQGLRLHAGSARRRGVHEIPQDAQRRRCSTPTPPTSAAAAARTSSPACPTRTAAAGSSATTGASRSTASTASSSASSEEKRALDAAMSTDDDHPRSRGALRADPRARRSCSRWRRATASTSRVPARTPRRPCSGSTSAIWPA